MRRFPCLFLSSLLALALWCNAAGAAEVRVFRPMEEGLSAMHIRALAMAEGFAQAVAEASQAMLPAKLDEARAEYFKEYLTGRAEPYVMGYKVLSTEASKAGLILSLDVTVNKSTLREGLRGLGLMADGPTSASVVLPGDLDEATRAQVEHLEVLSGLRAEDSALPRFTLERAREKDVYRARLETADREWMAVGKDIPALWLDLWARYFVRENAAEARSESHTLAVTGWFSPDAALEFDRVLRGWDSSVQDVRLVEMDMQPTGVGATWVFRLLSADRLAVQLQGFLPQRGLSYKLEERAAN
ncbi:hypothetical protein [Pseudodesulfovibrio sp.]|uniref:hypothetical protein n=1 Tax=Pseudodesulfovibrio sp. TaxID=2035812 RepID=UPI00261FE683|nr:hypothetical protein [Pseudodesulfovibrio sp.]MDD3310854.1 hypothetical protein [Pseudodesulfovibrio sp.]